MLFLPRRTEEDIRNLTVPPSCTRLGATEVQKVPETLSFNHLGLKMAEREGLPQSAINPNDFKALSRSTSNVVYHLCVTEI